MNGEITLQFKIIKDSDTIENVVDFLMDNDCFYIVETEGGEIKILSQVSLVYSCYKRIIQVMSGPNELLAQGIGALLKRIEALEDATFSFPILK
jgi:hypothetical protein